MDALKNKRTHLKGTVTRLEKFITQVTVETSLFEIRARLERLQKVYDQFQSLDIEMAAQGENSSERETELEEFESRYYKIKTKYTEIIDARLHSSNIVGDPLNSTTMQHDAMQKLLEAQSAFFEKFAELQINQQQGCQPNMSQSVNSSNPSADVLLPKLNVPVFDGKYSDFKSFFDLYTISIHNNNTFSAAQKFQYSKGLLKDEPANLIRHLQVTDQNYEEALLKLKERYDKPSLVVDSFIEIFLYILKSNNTQSLRNLCNVADKVIRCLRAQGNDAENVIHG